MPNGLSHTLIIIIITALISMMALSNPRLKDRLIFWTPAIARGQLYRFVSYGLVHADGNHLLFNMFTLYFFGSSMESVYQHYLGPFGFVIFYLLALIISIFPSYLQNRNNSQYASLGASGAVSAVLFAYILLAPWNLLYVFGVIPIPAIVFAIAYIAYSIYSSQRAKDNINHSAHLWGGFFGVAATIALNPKVISYFFIKLSHPSF